MSEISSNLRTSLVAAARAELEERGHADVSLRAVARRAGVSHAAPAYAFADRAGLLTAVATEGFAELAVSVARPLRESAGPAVAQLGERYVAFAAENPALYELMFRANELRPDDDLRRAQGAALGALSAATGGSVEGPSETTLVAWAFAHGLASLARGGALDALTLDGSPPLVADLIGRFARMVDAAGPQSDGGQERQGIGKTQ